MRFSFRDNHSKTIFRRSNSGQAVVEYIMILVVSVALILGGVYQFNSAFKVWAKNYFGDYLSCLLETGELPALGGTGGAATTGCNAIFKAFSIADGRPIIGDPIGGGGGGGTNGKDKSEKSEASDSGGSNAGYTKVSSSGGSRFGSDSFGSNRSGSGGGGEAANKPRKVYTGSTEDSLSGALAGSQSRAGTSRQSRFLVTGYYSTSGPKEQERKERILAKVSEGSRVVQNQRLLVKAKPPKPVEVAPDEPMSFGDYFRYLLIAAIIIALVIVIGGQFSQMSKEMD